MMREIPVKIVKLENDAVVPEYKTKGAAGFDLHAYLPDGPVVIYPGATEIFRTALSFQLPWGYEMQVRGRSGLAFKHAVTVTHGIGTVDCDYRGEVKVVLTNHGNIPFKVEHGDRVAQGIINEVITASWVLVEELDDTDRGSNGFGSTGV